MGARLKEEDFVEEGGQGSSLFDFAIRDDRKNRPAKKSDDSGSSGRVLAVRQREPFLVVCGVPTAIGALYEARCLVIAVCFEHG